MLGRKEAGGDEEGERCGYMVLSNHHEHGLQNLKLLSYKQVSSEAI